MLQRSRTFSGAESLTSNPLAEASVSFNGAAPFQARKAELGASGRPPMAAASTEPHLFRRGKGTDDVMNSEP